MLSRRALPESYQLFPNLVPLTRRERNEYGVNVDVAELLTECGADLVTGERSEIYGFDEFDAERIQAQLELFLMSETYPALAQCLVAQVGG